MRNLALADRRRLCPAAGPWLRRAARCLLDELLQWEDYDLAFQLIDAGEMARLNQQFLQHEGSTDVITFNYNESPGRRQGEIFISVPDAEAYARLHGCARSEEIARYIVHGCLHLAGHDDLEPVARRRMKREENRLLKELSRRFDWGKLENEDAVRRKPNLRRRSR